jgi:hypothetical protein
MWMQAINFSKVIQNLEKSREMGFCIYLCLIYSSLQQIEWNYLSKYCLSFEGCSNTFRIEWNMIEALLGSNGPVFIKKVNGLKIYNGFWV